MSTAQSIDDPTKYLDPQVLAKLRGLELRAKRIVEGYVAGLHRSPLHGFSAEFAEHREYVPGDDLRYVDWKVYGKSDKLYLKQFEEETNLLCYLALDVSESMAYQSPDAALSKIDYASCLSASLGYLVLRQQDSVGMITYDDEIRAHLRPSSVATQLKQLTHAMETASHDHKSRIGPVLHELAERLTRRSIVIVVSDLLDDVRGLLTGLKHLRHRRHDVIVFHVLDPAEIDFPFQRVTLFKGLEALGNVLTDPQSLRAAYQVELQEFLQQVRLGCRAQQVDYILLRTDQSLELALSSFLHRRMRRVI